MESPRVDLFKNTSEEAPSSLLPWWKKHDKVCFVWRLHVRENMMKCPWGDVSAEQQETQTCALQWPPTCWSNACIWWPRIFSTCCSDHIILMRNYLADCGKVTGFVRPLPAHSTEAEQHFSLICRSEEETNFLKLASLKNLVAMVELQNKSTLTWMQNISAARQWWAQLPPPDWRLIQLFLPLNWGLLGHAPSPRE